MLSIIASGTDPWADGRPELWPVFPLLWLAILVGAIVTAVVLSRRARATVGPRAGEARLAERFAAGEIDEDEYAARLAVLRRR